ncbi:hypothetical protein F4810DRAFT_724685 [Camillea tinctor]|nr:hypothetical protein F4810DRAFT_724685 [Camillea tinctor]
MAGKNSDCGYYDFKLGKKGRSIVVYAPVISVRTAIHLDKSKTIGVITTRNETKILQAAYSGWTPGVGQDGNCLDSKKWNHIALHKVAKVLKFNFPGNQRDNGNLPMVDEHRGRAHAGHVEYLDASEDWLVANLKKLQKHVQVGPDKRIAYITIDSQPCRPCLQFINSLQQHTGLVFVVNGGAGVGPTIVRIEGRRRYDTFGDTFEDSSREATPNHPDEMARRVVDEMIVINESENGGGDDSDVTMEEESPHRIEYGHRRGRMEWPKSPLQATASRVPANHEKLVADYKKKTPVWEWPGYNSVQEAAKQTASLGWRYARGALDAITADRDLNDSIIEEESEEIENEGGEDEEHDDFEKIKYDDIEDDDDDDDNDDDDDSEIEVIRVKERDIQQAPRNFDRWRYQPAENNESIFRTRFPFLNAQFGL